jgi:hypothetical protein
MPLGPGAILRAHSRTVDTGRRDMLLYKQPKIRQHRPPTLNNPSSPAIFGEIEGKTMDSYGDPVDPPNFRVAHARFLRRQDDRLADLRQAYERFTPEERAAIREALEKAEAASCELAELGIRLIVAVEIDEHDGASNTVPCADCEFSLEATLLAIRA